MRRWIFLLFMLLPTFLLSGVIFFEPSVFYHGGTNFSVHVSQNLGYATINIPLRFPLLPTKFVLSAAGVDSDDELLIKSMIFVESSMNTHAYSYLGAAGLMQLMPKTAEMLGVSNRFNPFENVSGGYRYLKSLRDQFGDWNKAIAAYHFGPGNVSKYGIVGAGKTYLERVRQVEAEIRDARLEVGFIRDTAWLSLRGGFNQGSASLNAALLVQPLGMITLGINTGVDLSSESPGLMTLGLGLSLSESTGVVGCVDLISKEMGMVAWLKLWGAPFQAGWDRGPVLTANYRVEKLVVSGGFYGGIPIFEVGLNYKDMWIYGGWNNEFYFRLDVGY